MSESNLKESELLLRLVKVYVVEYLATVHGVRCFQHEAINMLSIYILNILKNLSVQTKRTVSFQGRTLPNCLHLIDTITQKNIIKPIKLISFLNSQRNQVSKNIRLSYSGLEMLGKVIFEDETEEVNKYEKETEYENIRYVPSEYFGAIKGPEGAKRDSLPMRAPLDESMKKPLDYTYKANVERVEKEDKSVEHLSSFSNREMKRALGILSLQGQEQKPKKIMVSNDLTPKPKTGRLNSFKLIENL